VAIFVALVLGLASYPGQERVERRLRDLPVLAPGAQADELLAAARAYDLGEASNVVRLSPEEFLERVLPVRFAFAEPGKGDRSFRVRYLGKEAGTGSRVYLAERDVHSTESWSPERWAYKALEAEVQQASSVLRLTFERDVTGLVGLLLLDVLVGAIYGVIFGLILNVLGMEGIDKHRRPGGLPLPPPRPFPSSPRDTSRA
jgi:hypothetical protein